MKTLYSMNNYSPEIRVRVILLEYKTRKPTRAPKKELSLSDKLRTYCSSEEAQLAEGSLTPCAERHEPQPGSDAGKRSSIRLRNLPADFTA